MRRVPFALLAACVLAAVINPLLYIALGVPFQPSSSVIPVASALVVAPASAFLLWRFLSRPRDRASRSAGRWAEAISAAIVLLVGALMSQMVFVENSRRLGFAGAAFLSAWVFCTPPVFWRQSALEQRLTRVPSGFAATIVIVVLLVSGYLSYTFVTRPEHLI